MISINGLADLAMRIAGKQLRIRHIPGPLGVRGRNSDNRLIARELGWAPNQPLEERLKKTYSWIEMQATGQQNCAR
jgi:GDP-D-mannose 3',5'-epimerase